MTPAFERRLAKAEAAQANAGDLRQQIYRARQSPLAPSHSREELLQLAEDDTTVGRIARGWLRINFVAPSRAPGPVPAIDPETVLPAMAAHLYDRPLAFVLFAFDWDRDPSLRVVKLPEPWADAYASEYGPDAWACELLDHVGGQVVERAFDGRNAVDAIRAAISSGHGIGKSAITGWLVGWIMSTRPNARGVVTANTAPQLESKTWAEISKWNKRSLFGDWFNLTTGRGSMRMVAVGFEESWRCDAQTCREENSESFAGLHAADSTPFYLFDEASAIPAKIWEVAQGGMTDGEPMWFAFGNPTRLGTTFYDAFNSASHRWHTQIVDSRSVQITNKVQLQNWIDDFGLDSDFVKVRVRGIFPSASSLQFIPQDLVEDAMRREVEVQREEAVIVGVDVARFGGDRSCLFTRKGRDGRHFPPILLDKVDLMTLASVVADHVNLLKRVHANVIVAIDGGGVGGGVIDRLRQLGFNPIEVQFGSRANDPRRYANKRAEIWSLMREWLKGGALPHRDDIISDLVNVEYSYTTADAILLESKQSLKARGLPSPDIADAIALTFAVTAPLVRPGEAVRPLQQGEIYKPYAYLERPSMGGGWATAEDADRARRIYDHPGQPQEVYDPYSTC
ncbi:hypothetical protein PSCT_02884 [Pseudomonas sp. SCT]|uniref:terminase n=1 Tax=Pseudomonas sp. (strain SCT) TaxID=412955 RepID=UPI000EDC52B8|nr:terminase [Pseudomonas sp. SCT]GCA56676.1 hypothetical protein PSCT_02884 [Pseudomonas sp. SCT]